MTKEAFKRKELVILKKLFYFLGLLAAILGLFCAIGSIILDYALHKSRWGEIASAIAYMSAVSSICLMVIPVAIEGLKGKKMVFEEIILNEEDDTRKDES